MQNKSDFYFHFRVKVSSPKEKIRINEGNAKYNTKKIPTELNLQGFLYSIVY